MMWLRKHWLALGGITGSMTVSLVLVAQVVLRNLYRFLTFDQQFYSIFAQIQSARMASPVVLLLVAAFLYSLLAVQLWNRSRGGRIAAVLLGVPVWVLLAVVAVYATKVNDILFGDVLMSLLDVLQKGGLG